MKRFLAIILGSVGLNGAAAQVADDMLVEKPEIKHYSVDLIVFTYEEDVAVGNEVFLPDPPPEVEESLLDADEQIEPGTVPVFSDTANPAEQEGDLGEEAPPHWVVVPNFPPATASSVFDDAENEPSYQIVMLPEEEHMLGDALRQFALLDAYETLLHVAWTQPAYPEEETPAIDLSLFGNVPDGLQGTLTLYLSRYLHLVVDLSLDAPASATRDVDDRPSFFDFGNSRFSNASTPQPVRWRIQENRIFKNGDLRYFDHPKFGVLAKIVRVENEPGEEPGNERLIGRFVD